MTLFDVPINDSQVRLKATPASDRGEQTVHQCLRCGVLACVPSPRGRNPKLGDCPMCGDRRWKQQPVPVGCFA